MKFNLGSQANRLLRNRTLFEHGSNTEGLNDILTYVLKINLKIFVKFIVNRREWK